MYNPKPINTSNIILNTDIVGLIELIARNTHNVWAVGRIDEGWKYGPIKDSNKKETPDLIPYEELPESEKEYDRNTAIETIKVLLALGYEIKAGKEN